MSAAEATRERGGRGPRARRTRPTSGTRLQVEPHTQTPAPRLPDVPPPGPAPFRRPLLAESGGALVAAVADVVGDRVVDERPAAAGFTMSVASTVRLSRGGRVFVKAGEVGSSAGEAVTTGAELAPVIGDLEPALLGHRVVDGWSVAVYEHVPGEAVEEWDQGAVAAMQRLSHRLRDRLDPSPVERTVPYARAFARLLGCWAALDDPAHPDRGRVAHVAGLTLPHGLDVPRLAALERRWSEVLSDGPALQHGDLRADNVVREPGGRLWLVDWTHRWTAPGWADLVRLGPDLDAHGGHDPESFLAGSAWGDAPRDHVDVLLAGLAGRAWRDGHLPDVPGLPHLRRMQREQGDAALRWLARRLAR